MNVKQYKQHYHFSCLPWCSTSHAFISDSWSLLLS